MGILVNDVCQLCQQRFADGAVFCLHRVGSPRLRRCLKPPELLLLGVRYSSGGQWFRQDEDGAWLFHLIRTEYGFACPWPEFQARGAARGMRDVIDSDAIAERQEGPLWAV